ncbi:glucose-6-phosphate isomerase [Marinobacterium sediminicola]|uniref:Glucose-6-phosphate isomerase n=1 Tax=Marinobacterium sediminicola TaxID=518898 RepID=A0ABY1S0L5_9GAMM|nr:glucose-6-phosphate isomerase [Marinobacterium sediminicola]ULG68380.1 glucose-6-phosphate isomerase [Marinobacterium sediminicola]SMR74741.1 glucose-6-phosphate isomerase [Marinobacterium sediminicola]
MKNVEATDQLHQRAAEMPSLSTLFAFDPERGGTYRVSGAGIQLDYSKQRVDTSVLTLLARLAEQAGVEIERARLLTGEVVNRTENRAAWHTALRAPAEQHSEPQRCVEEQLQRMTQLVDKIQSGVWRGFSGKRITDVVNLGVGGSDLGPLMVTHALREYAEPAARALKVHFASTIDGSQLFDLLDHLNPETTLFIISSKSFTTIDTLSNADTVRSWLAGHCDDHALVVRCHFVGVSASAQRMADWGLPPENQLHFWEWVGGRFSLWSTIGLPIALALGMSIFRQLLAGAHTMDEHFRTAPLLQNLPVMLALLGIWNVNFLDIRAHAILPYDGRLKYFPPYLEQLEMESNGKSVSQAGEPLDYSTCPVLWGEIGANAQHAFYQLLHQGTQAVASDFILSARRYEALDHYAHSEQLQAQHQLNIANCLAQSRVLAFGSEAVEPSDNPWRQYPGNQPSSTLLLERLDPQSLGALIALYEHKVFTQAVIWDINPFDQWGVELGKQVALQLQPLLAESADISGTTLDSSTRALALSIRAHRLASRNHQGDPS